MPTLYIAVCAAHTRSLALDSTPPSELTMQLKNTALLTFVAYTVAKSPKEFLAEQAKGFLAGLANTLPPYAGGATTVFNAGENSPHASITPKEQTVAEVRRWMPEAQDETWGQDTDMVYFYDYEVQDLYAKLMHIQCLCFSIQPLCTCDQPQHSSMFMKAIDMFHSKLIMRESVFPHHAGMESLMIAGFTINGSFPQPVNNEIREFMTGSYIEKPRESKQCKYGSGFCEVMEDLELLFSGDE